MNNSWRLATIRGTDVKVHFTFPLLLLIRAVPYYQDGGLNAAALEVLVLLALFFCVLLHEFGHIGMARRFGIDTPDVILLPIGGVARLRRMPEEPRQELLIALAGPAVTLAIALLLYLVTLVAGIPIDFDRVGVGVGGFIVEIMLINVFLLGFNLIPAFPMDGGRVLRALLAFKLGITRATRIAARVGQGLAVAAAIWGIVGTPPDIWLVLIAIFVFFGAGAELTMVERRSLEGPQPALRELMLTGFQTIPLHTRLGEAAEISHRSAQAEFPVVDNNGRLEGLLTRDRLIHGLAAQGPAGTVAEVMQAGVATLEADMPFGEAFARLQASGLPALPVLDPTGALVGMLSRDLVRDLLIAGRLRTR
ncbi:MAG TPA: site-2 protease family protein [Gemmatimonadales bacterium]|nr:site-2 protease family protein [Gemmatimonadales bacterium]